MNRLNEIIKYITITIVFIGLGYINHIGNEYYSDYIEWRQQ